MLRWGTSVVIARTLRKKPLLDSEMRTCLRLLHDRVVSAEPLSVEASFQDTWYIFTDGAFDRDRCVGSIGGVLINPNGECFEFFGWDVGDRVVSRLLEHSSRPIHELEVLPVLVSAILWGHLFRGSQVIYFIDNEFARMAYIRGSGNTHWSNFFLSQFVQLEAKEQHKTWFSRVPTFSNLADGPSRMDFAWVRSRGASQVPDDWKTVAHRLGI